MNVKKINVGQPIYSVESKKLMDELHNLISRHNTLCSIEQAFANNEIAVEYFEKASQEVLNAGNQSVASMFVLAIENMSRDLEEYRQFEENSDIEAMQNRIRQLESENRIMKVKLDEISKLIGINKDEKNNVES